MATTKGNKKRPKYIQDIVNDINAQLRANYVKDENNDLFVWLCDYLLKRKMYEGYNFHKYGDKIVNGKPIVCLVGTADKNKFDFLQVW